MIIVSQDKKEITNFDNMMAINILDCEEDGFLLSAAFLIGIDDIYRELGYYKTEKRAQEVLQEIVGLYRRCQQVIGERGGIANFIYPPKVYEMPKE